MMTLSMTSLSGWNHVSSRPVVLCCYHYPSALLKQENDRHTQCPLVDAHSSSQSSRFAQGLERDKESSPVCSNKPTNLCPVGC